MAAKKPFDPDEIQQRVGDFLGRAVEAISKGREELLKQSRIGKVKLIDLTQLRRERARLVSRLGEEAYRSMQAGNLEPDDLQRTFKRIVEMDERIAAKEAEVETLRREEEARARGKRGTAKSEPAAGEPETPPRKKKPKRKKPPMDV